MNAGLCIFRLGDQEKALFSSVSFGGVWSYEQSL